MFPSPLPQLLTDYAAIFTQGSIRFSLLYLSTYVRGVIHIRRICGEKLSKRPSVKGHNSSKSTNQKILTLGTTMHHHLDLCQVSSISVDKCKRSCGFRHTYRQTDTFLTNQDEHPKNFGSLMMRHHTLVLLEVWECARGVCLYICISLSQFLSRYRDMSPYI
jgi:hypothetical protein